MERKNIGKSPAKKKGTVGAKKRKPARRGIRGVGDIAGMATKAGGLVLGAVGGRELNTVAVKMFPSLTPVMSGLLQMAVGVALPKFFKGAFVQNVGDGMLANGGMVLIVSTGIISGASDTMTYRLNGTSMLNVVNGVRGTSRLNVVNGPGTRINNQPKGTAPVVRVRNFALQG